MRWQEAVPALPPEAVPPEEAVADLEAVEALPPQPEVPEDLPDLAAEAAEAPVAARDLTPPNPRLRTKPVRALAATQPAPVPPPSVPVAATTPALPPRPAVAPSSGGTVLNPSPRADNRPPRYPAESLERGERGAVVLRIRVSDAGDVAEVLVERSSGFPLLDAAAVEAAHAWRYAPARMDGTPVSALVRQTVRFERRA